MAINLERFISNMCKNSCQAFYDSYVEANVKFRSKLGMKQVIIRRQLGKCCDWCASLAGIYNANSAPKNIYQRHRDCNCMVTYKTEKGYQDVWNKKEFKSQKEARKQRIYELEEEAKKAKYSINNYSKLPTYKSLSDTISKSWENILNYAEGKNKLEISAFLKKFGFKNNYQITKLKKQLIYKVHGGTGKIIINVDDLSYILYRHAKDFYSKDVLLNIKETIDNYDYVGKGKNEGDLNFYKLFEKNGKKYGLDIVTGMKSSNSDSYIVHCMMVGNKRNKAENRLHELVNSSNMIDKK